eukprot:SAG31_NODE_639_length_13309_cov_4.008468_13_plen_84_part_00
MLGKLKYGRTAVYWSTVPGSTVPLISTRIRTSAAARAGAGARGQDDRPAADVPRYYSCSTRYGRTRNRDVRLRVSALWAPAGY